MKIDYKKLLNINKNNINKKNINTPIVNNNYLFHYLILLDNLKGLKLAKFPVYQEDDDGLNGFHLAAKIDNIDILLYLIKKYPDYIYNKNSKDNTFVYYLLEKSLIKIITIFPKLDWNYLISIKLLKQYFKNFSYPNLIKIIKLLNIFDFSCYIYNIIYNDNISIPQKIIIFNKFSDEELNQKNSLDGSGILLDSLTLNDEKIFNYLVNRNIDYDYYTVINTENPFRIGINLDIINNKKFFSKILLLLYIKKNHNFDYELNNFADNIIHNILYIRINKLHLINNNLKIDYTIDTDILKYCKSDILWNQLNNYKISPIELVTNLDFNIYSSLLENIKISQLNKDTINKLNINETWLNFINKLEIYKENDDIILNELPYSNYTLFQSKFKDLALFVLFLTNKYKDLYIPKMEESYLIENVTADNTELLFTDDIIEKKQIFPWFISYHNTNEYYIHPYLNNLIKSNITKKKYAIVFLSRIFDSTLHANILFYNFEKLTVERFEPYGIINNSNIDEILEEELTWDTSLKYIKPTDYLPYVGFQTISNENNLLNQKVGDFGGFCLAWCIWYIETRISNINIEPKTLVNKLISRLNNKNIKFSEYIRNYSHKINNCRIEYLLNIGIDKKMISNLYFDNNTEKLLTNYIINKFN
jgi:hypothetical protein